MGEVPLGISKLTPSPFGFPRPGLELHAFRQSLSLLFDSLALDFTTIRHGGTSSEISHPTVRTKIMPYGRLHCCLEALRFAVMDFHVRWRMIVTAQYGSG